MDNSSQNSQEQENQATSSSLHGTNTPENHFAPGASDSVRVLDHDISTVWTAEEQAILVQGLNQHATEPPIKYYPKIALQLQNKGTRDVAARIKWMMTREDRNRKREIYQTGISIDERERHSIPSAEPASSSLQTVISSDESTMMQQAMGGVTGQLVQRTRKALEQISANIKSFKFEENISLFLEVKKNFDMIMSNWVETPEFASQMPPLPVQLDEEITNFFLSLSSSQDPDPEHICWHDESLGKSSMQWPVISSFNKDATI